MALKPAKLRTYAAFIGTYEDIERRVFGEAWGICQRVGNKYNSYTLTYYVYRTSEPDVWILVSKYPMVQRVAKALRLGSPIVLSRTAYKDVRKTVSKSGIVQAGAGGTGQTGRQAVGKRSPS